MEASFIPDMAQDIVRCDVCVGEYSAAEFVCNYCHIKMCALCVPKHISMEKLKKHDIVVFTAQNTHTCPILPECTNHHGQICDLLCKHCDIPVCIKCLSTSHNMHKVCDLKELCQEKKDTIRKENDRLEKHVVSKLEERRKEIFEQKSKLTEDYDAIDNAIEKRGEDLLNSDLLRKAVFKVMNHYKDNVAKMRQKDMTAVKDNATKIEDVLSDAKQTIKINRQLLMSNDARELIKFQTKEVKDIPPKTEVSLPKFTYSALEDDQICQLFGKLEIAISPEVATTVTSEKEIPLNKNYTPVQNIGEECKVHIGIKTNYDELYHVTILGSDEIWAYGRKGRKKFLTCLDRNGFLMERINKNVYCLSTNKQNELVYSDQHNLYVLRNGNSERLIRLWGWMAEACYFVEPLEMLICFVSVNRKYCKLVRYNTSNITQEIQYDEKKKPLFVAVENSLYFMDVNRNGDICLTDSIALVVVNKNGILKFRYEGSGSSFEYEFYPMGVATDRMSNILIADCNNDCIHIIDQNGKFLQYITCGSSLNDPRCLSIDSQGFLCLAEEKNAKIKFIKYF